MKKKITIAVVILVIIAIGAATGYHFYSKRFIYNKEGDLGNTTGNLYNEGLFCTYKGFVYFSNPSDNGRLYRMKEDGTGVERLCSDSVSYINICNDQIYYIRDNVGGNVAFYSATLSNGVCRRKIGSSDITILHSGVSDSLIMIGNDVYFRAYSKNDNSYIIRKAAIDGKSDTVALEKNYTLLDYSQGKIYFANNESNHNLMYYNLKEGETSECFAGNFYMPDCEGDYLYYIDLDNGHKITRMDLRTAKRKVISEDYAVLYNLNSNTGEIYYQAENAKDDHKLCKVPADGGDVQTVLEGDYTDINFTEEYVYFFETKGSSNIHLYRGKLSGGTPELYEMPVDRRE